VAPLAKANHDGKTAQIFQPILAGSELGKGYSELNDPLDQRARFEKQQELLAGGDEEAMMADDSFVEMLEHACLRHDLSVYLHSGNQSEANL
jgi:lysyl-tRNA synthetase class 2